MIYNEVNLVNHNSGWKGLIQRRGKGLYKISVFHREVDFFDRWQSAGKRLHP